jgi:hypothetical protein
MGLIFAHECKDTQVYLRYCNVPVLEVTFVALGAIAFANVVALLPARIAAGTPTAVLLRSE